MCVRLGCYPQISFSHFYRSLKERKRAEIKNQYNQAPHLTQDTNGKVTTSQLDITNESQEVSPFPAGDHKASTNRCAWTLSYFGSTSTSPTTNLVGSIWNFVDVFIKIWRCAWGLAVVLSSNFFFFWQLKLFRVFLSKSEDVRVIWM